MSLASYRRKKEAVEGREITLKKGVKVVLREWGCPSFFEAMVPPGVDLDIELSDKKVKEEQTNRALAHWVIKEIHDDDTKITDPEEIKKIVDDPLMWEFRLEIIEQATKDDHWLARPEHLKNSQISSLNPSSGGESTQKKVRAIQK